MDKADGRDLPHGEERSLLDLLSVLLRYRLMVVAIPLVVGGLFGGLSLLQERTYTSHASFRPQAANAGQSQIAALAAQFGVGAGSSVSMETPEFYARLLLSRAILSQLLEDPFTFIHEGEAVEGHLSELLSVTASTPEKRREKALGSLRKMVSSRQAYDTGVVTVSVSSPWPGLSAQIAQRLLDFTAEFNVQTRQSSASAERAFIDGRYGEAAQQLRVAEDRLQAFLQQNRQYQNSPALMFEAERLQREVAVRQQVYVSLAQALEQARIDEVRDTPVLTLLEAPEPAAYPDARGTMMRGLLGFGFGGVLALVLALLRDYLRRSREANRSDYREFVRVGQSAFGRLRRDGAPV